MRTITLVLLLLAMGGSMAMTDDTFEKDIDPYGRLGERSAKWK